MFSHVNVTGVGIHQQLSSKWVFSYFCRARWGFRNLSLKNTNCKELEKAALYVIHCQVFLDSKLAYIYTMKLVDPHSNHCHKPKE